MSLLFMMLFLQKLILPQLNYFQLLSYGVESVTIVNISGLPSSLFQFFHSISKLAKLLTDPLITFLK
jgi:hypothetical protein